MKNYVELGTNLIHVNAFVDQNVIMGKYNIFDAYSNVDSISVIGDNNYFGPFTSIGAQPEDRSVELEVERSNPKLIIGNNNKFFSHVTIQRGTIYQTNIGNDNFVMSYVSVGHDSKIGNYVNISPRVILGGHVKIMDYATLGMGTIVHQKVKIGGFSMVGMGSVINRHINPFSLTLDNEKFSVQIGLNHNALEKNKIDSEWTKDYSNILNSGKLSNSVPDIVAKTFQQWFEI
jgi:UDP-N-acetylglucosamine acyltransferase